MTRYTEESLTQELWNMNFRIWQIDEILIDLEDINKYCEENDLEIIDYLEEHDLIIQNRVGGE